MPYAPPIELGSSPSEASVTVATEYCEVLSSIRHYSNLRFASLTLFSAVTAGLFGAAFGPVVIDPDLRERMRVVWPVVGMLASTLFLVLECCVTAFVVAFRRRVRDLYPNTHFEGSPQWARVIARNMFKSFYLAMLIFWLAAAFSR
jgi:hypothetical protein